MRILSVSWRPVMVLAVGVWILASSRSVGTPVRPAAPPATPAAPAPEKPAVTPAPATAKPPLPGVPYVPGTPVPPGYRLEKIASPDGTIITVLVKIGGGG